MGAVFSLAAGTSDITTAAPDSVATAMHVTFLVAAALILAALAIATASSTLARHSAKKLFRTGLLPGREPGAQEA